jgi:hypothetical protein
MYLTEGIGGIPPIGEDQRNGSLLGRLRFERRITQAEYLAGDNWRQVYLAWIKSIESPEEMQPRKDGRCACEVAKDQYLKGLRILEAQTPSQWGYQKRKRVVHAVNSIAVFEDPEELGDFEFTLKAARVGLKDLASQF